MDLQKIDTLQKNIVDLALKIMHTRDKFLSNGKSDEMFKTVEECKNRAKDIVNNIYDAFGYSELDPIFEKICNVVGVSKEEMIFNKNNRESEYCIPRQVHLALLHVTYNLSQAKAGKLYYGKDHASVNHSIKTVNNLLDTDREFREKYRPVFEKVYNDNPYTIKKLNINYIKNGHENAK